MPKSGGGCEVLFLAISDGVTALDLGKETKKKAVTLCGKNPGMMFNPFISTIQFSCGKIRTEGALSPVWLIIQAYAIFRYF